MNPAQPQIELKQPPREFRKTTVNGDGVHLLDDPLAHIAYQRRSARDARVCDQGSPTATNHWDQLLCIVAVGKRGLILYGSQPKIAAQVNSMFRSQHEVQRHFASFEPILLPWKRD